MVFASKIWIQTFQILLFIVDNKIQGFPCLGEKFGQAYGLEHLVLPSSNQVP